jgi:2-aminoethylphosphonate transport system substrate-binding protein
MRRRRPYRVALALAMTLVMTSGVAACSADSRETAHGNTTTARSDDYCRGTTYGSQVVVYSVKGLEYWYSAVLTNFQANCGVHVLFQAGPDVVTRLAAEKASPYADIIVAPAPEMATADAGGLLEPDGSPGSTGVPDDRCGRGRHWCDVVENVVSFVYNPKLLADPPRTWQDLLSERFIGQILMSRPDKSAVGRQLLVLLDQLFGREAALRYVARLERSVKSHWVTTDTMARLVASGAALVANGDLSEHSNDIVQYHNLVIWFPALGSKRTTLALPYAAALVRGGRNRDNAVALLKYMWSKAGQAAVSDVSAMPARTDVVANDCRSRDLRRRLAGVRILRPDWEQVARDEKVLDQAWLRIKRAPDGTPPPPASLPPLKSC